MKKTKIKYNERTYLVPSMALKVLPCVAIPAMFVGTVGFAYAIMWILL